MLRAASQQSTILSQSWSATSAPADTSEDTLATITIPAGAMRANDAIRVTSYWSFTNSVNNKTLKVHFGGVGGAAYLSNVFTTQTPSSVTTVIANANATNAQTGFSEGINLAATTSFGNATTSAVDTTASTTVVITGTKASAGEALSLLGYIVEILRA